ncbi:MAG: sigma-70 family RNA polymerase sigma factor [Polyangiaceae bacterium]|nr:sigma-70 family RNA polymerase sigma factor [Polyangiaceae bacterium]
MPTSRPIHRTSVRVAREPVHLNGCEPTPAMIRRAIARDPQAVRALVDALTPVIRARTARVLRRRGYRRDVRQELLDLTQQVFLALLADGGCLLRSWDPARGLSVVNFVGLVAEQITAAALRGSRGRGLHEELVAPEELDREVESSRSPERIVASTEALGVVLRAVRDRLSARGLSLFQSLFVEGRSIEEVAAANGMSVAAVYAWRSRLGRLVESIAGEVMSQRVDTGAPTPRREISRMRVKKIGAAAYT